MIKFPTRIPDCDSQSCSFGFISSDPSICSVVAFPLLGSSDHVVFSVSIDFPSNSKKDDRFPRTAFDYSRADWDGLFDHLRDFPWVDVFNPF